MTDIAMKHPLAHREGLTFVLAYMMARGGMCPKCGHGTRVTSKRWAKCKKCGERVRRRSEQEVDEMVEASQPHEAVGP